MNKFLYAFFVILIFQVNVAFCQRETGNFEQIKYHGPHAGYVRMSQTRKFGVEVIPLLNNRFDLYVLQPNQDTLESKDLKVTIFNISDSKEKSKECKFKEYKFNCLLPVEGRKALATKIKFKVTSKDLNIDDSINYNIPLTFQ